MSRAENENDESTTEKVIEAPKAEEGSNSIMETIDFYDETIDEVKIGDKTGLSDGKFQETNDVTTDLEVTTNADDVSTTPKTPKERYFDYLNEKCG
jgi:hypothetical protein